MSIYGTFLCFDGEEPDEPQPIRYQQNKYPLDDTDRDGSLYLSYIPAHIASPEMETDSWPAPLKPYLRLSVATKTTPSGIDLDGVDVMLDKAQVKMLVENLSWWLENSESQNPADIRVYAQRQRELARELTQVSSEQEAKRLRREMGVIARVIEAATRGAS